MSASSQKILEAGWRETTHAAYKYIVQNYFKFAKEKQWSQFEPSIGNGLDYLSYLFEQGYSYRRLCVVRAALSAFVFITQDFGSHFLVKRFFKGVFNLAPTVPTKSLIASWDANQVIVYLDKPNDLLNFKFLSFKLAFMLAITSAQRVQTLSLIKISNIIFHEDKCTIIIDQLLKTSRNKFHQQPIEYSKFGNQNLCIVDLLQSYIDITKEIRGEEDYLFISYAKPNKKISASTISRWIKETIAGAGIDIVSRNIKSHSTRSQATSLAEDAGLSISHIMASAGWSRQNTFTQFYKKKIVTNIGQAVLDR